ncbi:MAG: VOC family protein [Hyphomonadaceae bacterium]
MKQTAPAHRLKRYVLGMLLCITACSPANRPPSATDKAAMQNPVYHFEIPVTDMDRAIQFYEDVLGHKLTRQEIDGYEMAFFPRADGKPGASGALAKGDVYVPSKTGAIIYFDVPDIDPVLEKAKAKGAKVLYPKKSIGEAGFVAEIEDSEGNRIALNALVD